MLAGMLAERAELVRRGRTLTYATLAFNGIEVIVAIAAGLAAYFGS